MNSTTYIPHQIQIIDKQEPRALVCVHMSCEYCGFVGDGISLQFINYLFGIKHCRNQSCCNKAKRDCADYMRKYNLLLMNRDLIDSFGLINNKYEVIRSNGDIENNWKIYFSQILDYAEFQFFNDEWHIKLIKYDEDKIDSAITKFVPVSSINFNIELIEKLNQYKDYPNNEYVIYLEDENTQNMKNDSICR